MNLSNIRVVSGGRSETTKVFVDGIEVKGITNLSIEDIGVDSVVKVHLTVLTDELDLVVNELLMESANKLACLDMRFTLSKEGGYYVGLARNGVLEWREVNARDLNSYGLTSSQIKSMQLGKVYRVSGGNFDLKQALVAGNRGD